MLLVTDSELFERGMIRRGIGLDWLLTNVERIHSVTVRQSPDCQTAVSLIFNLHNPKPNKYGKNTAWVYSGDYYYSVNFTQAVPVELIASYLRVLLKGVRGVEIDWFGLKEYTFNNPNFPPLQRPSAIGNDNQPGQYDAVLGGRK